MVCVAWVFFRAESVGQAVDYLGKMTQNIAAWPAGNKASPTSAALMLSALEIASKNERIQSLWNKKTFKLIRWFSYLVIVILVSQHFGKEHTFIYFQF